MSVKMTIKEFSLRIAGILKERHPRAIVYTMRHGRELWELLFDRREFSDWYGLHGYIWYNRNPMKCSVDFRDDECTISETIIEAMKRFFGQNLDIDEELYIEDVEAM